MQAKFAKNNEPEIVPVPAAPAPVVEEVEEDLTDDMELVAVIAAQLQHMKEPLQRASK